MPTAGFVTAYLLHSRAYQDDRLLLDLLVQGQGRQRAVARRPGKKQQGRARWPEFTPLTLQLVGQGELKSVRAIEETQLALPLQAAYLFSAMYLNELICRVFPPDSQSEALFDLYQQSLLALGQAQLQQQTLVQLEFLLRQFEFALLAELGVAVSFQFDRDGFPLASQASYGYQHGFVPMQGGWLGADLQAIAQPAWSDPVRRCAKQLTRQLLAPWLGDKPLQSRQLFQLQSTVSLASQNASLKDSS